jgi:hypothetical protein
MNTRDTAARLDRYVQLLNERMGASAEVRDLPVEDRSAGRMATVSYPQMPGPGLVTAFTYGLSLADHPDWTSARRELCIVIRSGDEDWGLVMCRMAEVLRGRSAFAPGKFISRIERVVEESPMRTFLLQRPVLPQFDDPYLLLDSGDLVEVVEVYPVHDSERDFIHRAPDGSAAFWSMDWDRFDPLREPVV